jgi:hypothetical protein
MRIERKIDGLKQIVDAVVAFGDEPGFDAFLRKILIHCGRILSGGQLGHECGLIINCCEKGKVVGAQIGYGDVVVGKSIYDLLDAESVDCIESTQDLKPKINMNGHVALRFQIQQNQDKVVFFNYKRPLEESDVELLGDFVRCADTAYRERLREFEAEMVALKRIDELKLARGEFEKAMSDFEQANERLAASNLELEAARMITEQDMRMAVNIQQNVLPKVVPPSPRWDVAYFFKAMSGYRAIFMISIQTTKVSYSVFVCLMCPGMVLHRV